MASQVDVRNWYVIRDRKKVGPLPETELVALAARGELQPRDMVLCEGHTRWLEAASVVGLFAAATAPDGVAAPLAIPVAAFSASAPMATIAPPPLPSATMLTDRLDDTPRRAPVTPPIQLPGYDIDEELGRGGMGVVYKARQQKASRVVALKMILSGAHAGKEDLARFQTEAEAVARLQHPHIIQVYEVGEHEGRPYFSLEYCGGGTLDRKLRDNPLPPKDAARLVEVLARAMHHAHTHHILHRDLKPANVLLTEDGVPKITDFGLAKKLDETGQTASGAVMGTPSYMSPEQASGKAKHLTASTDVYALGSILYDCLAGRPPFRAATALDTILQVITDAPVPPCHLNPKVPADLQTICLKCLEKNPAHRYATAEELAEDLRRFTSGEPIQARPAGFVERGWKWAKRRPAAAALLTVSLVGALAILIGAVYFTGKLSLERNAALEQKQEAEQQRERAVRGETDAQEQKHIAEKEKARAEDRAAEAQRRYELSRRSLFTSQVWRAAGVWDRNPFHGRALLLDPLVCPAELRDFAWGYYQRLCTPRATPLRIGTVNGVAASPDGTLFATAGGDATVRLWHLDGIREKVVLRGHKGAVNVVAFSPKGDILVSGGTDNTIKLWDVAKGTELQTLEGHTRHIQALAFSADGKDLISAQGWDVPNFKGHPGLRFRDGEVRSWEWADGKPSKSKVLFARDSGVICLKTIPNGRLAAVGLSHESVTKLVDLDKGGDVGTFNSGNGWNQGVDFSPDGQTVAIGTATHLVYLWDVRSRVLRHQLKGHQNEISAVAFSPDGRSLASGCYSGSIKFWNPANGKEVSSLPSGFGDVKSMAFTPEGQSLIVGYRSGAVVWGVRTEASRNVVGNEVLSLTLRDDGNLLIYGSKAQGLRLRELPGGKETQLNPPGGVAAGLALSRDGKTLAVDVNYNESNFYPRGVEVQIWDVAGKQRAAFPTKELLRALVLTSTGQRLYVLTDSGKLRAWDVEAKTELPAPAGHATGTGLALSPDGAVLAVAVGKDVHLVDLEANRARVTLSGPADNIFRLAFTPDGKELVTGGQGQLHFWIVATGRERKLSTPVNERPLCLAFTPDGRTLALGCGDRTIRLVDVETGQIRAVLSGHSREVTGLAFTPDGRTLISGCGPYRTPDWVKGGEIKFWEAAPYR